MKCPECDRENNDHEGVCLYCGSPLPEVTSNLDVRTSKLAVYSCIFGVATILFFASGFANILLFLGSLLAGVLALIVGVVSLIWIELNYGRLTGRGLAAMGIVIPVAMFFIAILTVGKPRRSTAYRLYCGTNLSGIGKAMLVYSNDYDGKLPRAGGADTAWGATANWRAETAAEAYGLDDGDGEASISSSLFLLIKYAEVTPKSFRCIGDKKVTEFTPGKYRVGDKKLADLWDFGPEPSKHCSYTYHYPYGEYALTSSSDPGMAVAADRNPWLDIPGRKARSAKDWSRFDPDGGREVVKFGNAVTHRDDGQNVLFIDGHTTFEKLTFCGVNEDNIYTTQADGDIRKGVRATISSRPANKTDSLLLHDPPKGASK